ncbi:MAG: hypothetical protein AABW41_02045 [Nanoarchaeota archaeon]
MTEVDIVVSELKITKEGVFDFDSLYKTFKDWLNLHQFDFFEKNYIDITKVESKEIKIKFESEKKIDEYLKFGLEFTIKVSDFKIVLSADKKKKLVKGALNISISSAIQSDYAGEWEGKPFKKFMRGIYDKFIEGDKRARLNSQIKEETYSLYNEIKAFLNLQRF